jgi:hypothetical protein
MARRSRPWTPEEDQALMLRVGRHEDMTQIAADLRRNLRECHIRYTKLREHNRIQTYRAQRSVRAQLPSGPFRAHNAVAGRSAPNDAALRDEWLKRNRPTKCPPGFAIGYARMNWLPEIAADEQPVEPVAALPKPNRKKEVKS